MTNNDDEIADPETVKEIVELVEFLKRRKRYGELAAKKDWTSEEKAEITALHPEMVAFSKRMEEEQKTSA